MAEIQWIVGNWGTKKKNDKWSYFTLLITGDGSLLCKSPRILAVQSFRTHQSSDSESQEAFPSCEGENVRVKRAVSTTWGGLWRLTAEWFNWGWEVKSFH